METVYYTDGDGLHVSNARIMSKNLTIVLHNVSSVRTHPKQGKSPVWGYVLAAFGSLAFMGGLGEGSSGVATLGFFMALAGALIIYLRRPRHQVEVMTNAGEPILVYEGRKQTAAQVNAAINNAVVAGQSHSAVQNARAVPAWAHA